MAELKEVPTEELLSFQDYPTSNASDLSAVPTIQPQLNINISDDSGNFDSFHKSEKDFQSQIDGENSSTKKSFWSVEYFQQYFDVNTVDVKNRILGSVIPRKNHILRTEMKTRPDMYGPFWISVTLIFAIAISGNIANYLQYVNGQYHWKYDFHLVSYAATTIFMYVTLVPLGLWGLFKWSSKQNFDEVPEIPNALELICIYGYSLSIYIPASILWTIQISWLQWLFVLIATLISGSVLLLTLAPSLESSRHKLILGIIILSLHLLLAAGFMLFFFHVPEATFVPAGIPATVMSTIVTNKT